MIPGLQTQTARNRMIESAGTIMAPGLEILLDEPILIVARGPRPHGSQPRPEMRSRRSVNWLGDLLCKTKPIPAWHGHTARGRESSAGWAPQTRDIAFGNPCPCHANAGRRHCERGVKCAKQTQSAGDRIRVLILWEKGLMMIPAGLGAEANKPNVRQDKLGKEEVHG